MTILSQVHSEVFHYTTSAGLAGIVSTGTLRATHHAFLNDHEEYNLFFTERLPEITRRSAARAISSNPDHPLVMSKVKEHGKDGAIQELSETLRMALAKSMRDFETPYVTSFGAAASEATRSHGLLSQWRAYGQAGAYAIVFDSAGFEKLWPLEASTVKNVNMFWGNVDYVRDHKKDDDLQDESKIMTATVVDALARWLLTQDAAELEPAFTPVVQLACLLKHWGFSEENEVRFIVSMPNKSLVNHMPGEFKLKPVFHFDRDGAPVPYLSLLEEVGPSLFGRLPIKRIIVGPHPDKLQRKVAAEILLDRFGYDAPVHVSDIPYRGR